MFAKIQHIGYLAADLDAAIAWYEKKFSGKAVGRFDVRESFIVPSGGRGAFVRFGGGEVELIEPVDKSGIPQGGLALHHVGYVVPDMEAAMAGLSSEGLKFADGAPFTNPLGFKVAYFNPASTNGMLIHLTQYSDPAGPEVVPGLPQVEKIVHAGYLVRDLEGSIAWYVDNFGGTHVGGGPSRTGGRNACVNFDQVQVELIQPTDASSLPEAGYAMDHVGYAVGDIHLCMGQCQSQGFKFGEGAPLTNSIKQQVAYFDTATSMGSRMHLTQLPD